MEITLSSKQAEFLYKPAFVRGFCGGRGAGKSVVGAYNTLKRAVQKPNRLFVVVTDNYKRLKSSSLRTLVDIGDDLIRKVNKSSLTVEMVTGTQIEFRSASDPDVFRGPNYSFAWIDEASLVPDAVFKTLIASLRDKGEQGELIATFTPKGKNHWTYEQFGKGKKNTSITFAKTSDNPFNAPTFEETISEFYTKQFQRQELDGEFLDAVGTLFDTSWFKFADDVQPQSTKVRFWDLAATPETAENPDPDWASGVLMSRKQKTYMVEDVQRFRASPAKVEELVITTARADGRQIKIRMEQEPGASGKMMIDHFKRLLKGYDFAGVPSQHDKYTRAVPFAAACERKEVLIRAGTNWNQPLLNELQSFPDGTHDDMVDGCSGAFNFLSGFNKAYIV